MKAFIFDLDGTLIDSLADIAEAVNRALDQHGFPRQPVECFPQLIGEGVGTLVERAVPPDALHTLDISSVIADYQHHYADTWRDKTKPYDGITEVISALRSRDIKTAVLSNKPDHFTKLCCDHFFAPDSFDIVLGAREAVPRKPHPQAGFELAAELGVSLNECLYIGDSGLDMAFAVNSGMLPVGVLWGFRSESELRAHGASRLMVTPQELLSLI
ncbi:MAG: HAD family hydrolase [Verrucomicrobia bacterium]|nr:HAD family hydrolase [Verrucomicrobiota bacterium]